MPPRSKKRVEIVIPSSSDWYRRIIDGIAVYARLETDWTIYFQQSGPDTGETVPDAKEVDGAIVRVASAEHYQKLAQHDLPVVNVSWRGEHSSRLPKVTSDEASCGRIVAEYFRDIGLNEFAYIGPLIDSDYASVARDEYCRLAESYGAGAHVFAEKALSTRSLGRPDQDFVDWFAALPRPVGIMAYGAFAAVTLLHVCESLGVKVPDEAAVLSAEQDSLSSRLAPIELSTVDLSPRRVGYEAAKMLHQMMNGMAPPESQLIIAPAGIVERESTQTRVIADPALRAAVKFIHANAHRPIQTADLLGVSKLSRRRLEQKFREILGTSPASEIRAVRLARAKRLLLDSELTIAEIAHRVGFDHPEVLARNFRREFGESPGKFRLEHQLIDDDVQ